MAKDKSTKSDSSLLKRKKQSSNDSEVPAAEILTKVKKKQKKMEIEVSIMVINHACLFKDTA